ncbi:collagen alpha-5(VI) chain-like isoform X1 [Mytilus galloprovincialis]|uniref:collagen alpha-5(VI) chain-like isoform X1 n=1 Tax=Mytilus galloprovincialis TaxID=29158 RepID=UPI003F7BA315
MYIAPVLVIFLSLFVINGYGQFSTSNCPSKADIVFVLDASSSEGSTNFQKQLNFVRDFVSRFSVGSSRNQFSVVTFASSVKNEIWLNEYISSYSLRNAINKITYQQGITNTHLALDFVRQNSFLPSNGGRPDAEKVVIVLTDGQSTDPAKTKTAAEDLHLAGAQVISIGIGSGIGSQELETIASDKQHAFKVASFDALRTIETQIQQAACQPPSLVCSKKKADIVFVLDASSSIGTIDFQKQLDFVKNTVRQFTVGPTSTQFSVLSFSDQVYKEFKLNQYSTKTSVISAISKIKFHTGTTNTHLALNQVTNDSFSIANGGRQDAAQIVIFLTDGQSTYPPQTLQAAKNLHKAGPEVIAIGVGSGANTNELTQIATDNNHVFQVANFDALATLQTSLEKTACKTNECRGAKADIVFLLDSSSSEGSTNFETQLQFVSNFSSRFFIGPDAVQIGLATFSSNPQNQFWLNTYSNLSDVLNALQNVPYTQGGTNTAEALSFAKNSSFTKAHGARDGIPKVLIVLTDGQSQSPPDTAIQARNLHKTDIKVISIGIGSSVNKDELITIATDPGHAFTVANFSALKDIALELEKQTCKDETPLGLCGAATADVVFVLDASSSEGSANFQKQVDFVKDFVKRYQIGPNNVQIGLVTFSTYASNQFYFNTYHDQASVLNKLNSIPYNSGSTHTDKGLQYARLFYVHGSSHGQRAKANQIVVVLTDGQSSSPSSTTSQAKQLHDTGATVFAIGIGSNVNTHELQTIADSPHHVYQVSGFDALNGIQYELNQAACAMPTPPPTVDPECGSQPADIYFLLDSSGSVTPTNFKKQLQFVKDFASQYVIGPANIQIGVATFSTSVHERIRLDQYKSTSQLVAAITSVYYDGGLTYTDDALKYARTTAFTHGGRPNVQKIVVVLTDGKSYSHTNTVTEANKLKTMPGVKVISIGIGSSVDRNELLDIASDSSHMFTVAGFNSLTAIKSEISFAACQSCGFVQRADIIFALDASSSESSVDFQNELNFMSRFVNDLPVGPNNVQFGLVTFGSTAHNEFFLNQYGDKQSTLDAIQKATYVTGTTATGDALQMIRQQHLLPSHGARNSSKHFIIVLTDGASTNKNLTAAQAALLKQENAIVIAIGVGSGIDKSELNVIATDSKHVFNTQDFITLQQIQQEVKSATCDALKTTLPPTTLPTTTVATTVEPFIETPAPTQPNIETPASTQPNIETPAPTKPNIETPAPTQPNIETPAPTQPNIETPDPNREYPITTTSNRETPAQAFALTPSPDPNTVTGDFNERQTISGQRNENSSVSFLK